jgi:hypothetical protein
MYFEQDGSKRQEPAKSGESSTLYAATSPNTSPLAARSRALWLGAFTSGECRVVIGLKTGERRIEHFPARHKDHVQSRWRLLFSEQLPGEALGPVSHDRGPQFPRGRDAQP